MCFINIIIASFMPTHIYVFAAQFLLTVAIIECFFSSEVVN